MTLALGEFCIGAKKALQPSGVSGKQAFRKFSVEGLASGGGLEGALGICPALDESGVLEKVEIIILNSG